jgi:hypothetical protein
MLGASRKFLTMPSDRRAGRGGAAAVQTGGESASMVVVTTSPENQRERIMARAP